MTQKPTRKNDQLFRFPDENPTSQKIYFGDVVAETGAGVEAKDMTEAKADAEPKAEAETPKILLA